MFGLKNLPVSYVRRVRQGYKKNYPTIGSRYMHKFGRRLKARRRSYQ